MKPGDLEFAKGYTGIRPQLIEKKERRLMMGAAKIDEGDGVIFNDLYACNAYDAADVAARIECPVTVIVGSEDKMTPPKATAQLVAGFSEVELKHLDGIGHMMMLEAPNDIRKILLEALQ